MTSARVFLDTWEAQGVAFQVSVGLVRWKPKAALPEEAVAQLQAHKSELLVLLAERQRQAAIDLYEERAAIAEFDGGLSREEAEALAREEVRRVSGVESELHPGLVHQGKLTGRVA